MNKYIVAIEDLEEQEELEFKEFIEEYGLGWWHWIDNVWLIVDSRNRINIGMIRDELKKISRDSYSLVMEVNDNTWAGWGPSGENKDMFKWLKNTWNR